MHYSCPSVQCVQEIHVHLDMVGSVFLDGGQAIEHYRSQEFVMHFVLRTQ